MRYAIEEERYLDAFHLFDALLNGDLLNTTSYFYNVTGIRNYFNYLLTEAPEDQGDFVSFITHPERRKQIHVGNLSYGSQGETVEKMLLNDMVKLRNHSLRRRISPSSSSSRCKVWLGKSLQSPMRITVF